MYIPVMYQGMKFQIQNALHATQVLLSDRGSEFQQITLPEGSAISAAVKLKGSGAKIIFFCTLRRLSELG